MSTDIGNIAFIIWRECVEALLIVGILNAWIGRQSARERRPARVYLWSGVAAGLVVAIALAAALSSFGSAISGTSGQLFQTAMELVAAALIVEMAIWMQRHGRTLKNEMESGLSASVVRGQWWGVFALALIAVAREGGETVVFLYGTLAAGHREGFGLRLAAGAFGFAGAVLTYALLQLGSRVFSWRLFFRVSGAMLLLLAGALLVTAVDNLLALDYLPDIGGRLWDTSHLLSDTSSIGALVAALTGYRARPDLMQVITLVAYWGLIAVLFRSSRAPAQTA